MPAPALMNTQHHTGSARAIDRGDINGLWVTASPDETCQGESWELLTCPLPNHQNYSRVEPRTVSAVPARPGRGELHAMGVWGERRGGQCQTERLQRTRHAAAFKCQKKVLISGSGKP